MRTTSWLSAALTCALLLGCPSPTPVVDPPGKDDAGTVVPDPDGGTEETLATSAKANVRFKRSARIANDFAQALALPPAELCKELGQYSCTELVHPIALGGVEPYGIGLYEPLPFTGATTPIVVDRVALSGCIQRVEKDLAAPADAVLFKGVTPDGAGKLGSLDAPAVQASMDLLYQRALLRPITLNERGQLAQLYRDVEASGKPEPAKAWMELACFTVLTSVESLFY